VVVKTDHALPNGIGYFLFNNVCGQYRAVEEKIAVRIFVVDGIIPAADFFVSLIGTVAGHKYYGQYQY